MTTWTDWVSLISFRMAARVVVLPLPVAPVTRMRPFFSFAIWLKNIRQLERLKRRNDRLQLAHDDGEVALLAENIDAEARFVGQRVAAIAGAGQEVVAHQAAVTLHESECDLLGLKRSQLVRSADRQRPV